MERLFLDDTCNKLAPFVDGGKDPSDPYCVTAVNEACRRILKMTTASDYLVRFECILTNGTVVPPREINSIYGCIFQGTSIPAFDQLTRFAGAGPSKHNVNLGFEQTLQKMGVSPTYYDIAGTKNIEVTCTDSRDAGVQVKFRGMGGFVSSGSIQKLPIEETLTVGTIAGTNVSTLVFTSCSYVRKPITYGPLFVWAIDAISAARFLVAIYHKDETAPQYTRYQIPGLVGKTGTVELLGKKRFIPAIYPDDELAIGDLDAIKNMLVAMWEFRQQDYKAHDENVSRALAEAESSDRQDVGAMRPGVGIRYLGSIPTI